MSMILALRATSQENIDAVLKKPALVWDLLKPDACHYATPSQPKRGFLKKLFGRVWRSDDSVPARRRTLAEGTAIDLDKSWQAVHFLLTGTAWEGGFPQAFLLHGGTTLQEIEVGYGSPRILDAKEVAEVQHALAMVSPEQLLARFDAAAMTEAEIYPEIWSRDSRDECVDYIQYYYVLLRQFVNDVHATGFGLVITVE